MKRPSTHSLYSQARFLACCILLLVLVLPLSAQTNFQIKGTIADSVTRQTLSYVTVGLKNEKGEPVKSTLTKEDGSFLLAPLQPGKYSLTVVALGYRRKTILVESMENVDLLTIYMSPEASSLKEVTVLADKPLIKMDIDKISYDLQADPESKVNSVLDMIPKVPLLSLDHEDNILMKGSGQYRILINGKPSAMLEKSPKDILRSMPASTIQNIEVITNPPAKYDGEGLTGIINIVTVKKIDNGYNGNINLSYRSPRGGPAFGSSFNFKQGKWGVSVGTFGNMYNDPLNINFNERQVFGLNSSNLRQDGTVTYNSKNMGGNMTLSYELDSLNLISVQLSANTGKGEMNRELSSLFRSPGAVLEAYKMLSTGFGKWRGSDASLNYQLGFKKSKSQFLTLSYRHTQFYDNRNLDIILSEKVNSSLLDFRQFNEGGPSEQTIQLDYVQAVKKATMETGIKGIFRDNYSNFQYRSKNLSGVYELNPALSNQYDNIQNVLGLYNSWQVNLKKWGFKAGLRLEQTKINADFMSSATVNKQDYTNLLPSVSVSRKMNTKLSLGIAYSQRIQRPSIWDLNPNINRENPNLERTGNSGLKPVLANNFQLTLTSSGKTTLSTVFSHSYTNNALQFYLLYDTQTQINRLMPFNTGTNKSTGMNINISHPITSKWNTSFNTNLNYVKVTGFVENTPSENEGITGNFMLSSGYRFDKGWRINGNINYALTPFILLQGEGRTIVFSSLSVNKDFLKEKLSLSAQLSNPFTKHMYFPNNLRTDNYEFVKSDRSWFRVFAYSLNYKFGKLKGTITKNKRGINNDDVEGGAKP